MFRSIVWAINVLGSTALALLTLGCGTPSLSYRVQAYLRKEPDAPHADLLWHACPSVGMRPMALRAAFGEPVESMRGDQPGETIEVFRVGRSMTMVYASIVADSLQAWTVRAKTGMPTALAAESQLDKGTVGRISAYLEAFPDVPVTTGYYLYHQCYHRGMDSMMVKVVEGPPAEREVQAGPLGRPTVVWIYQGYHHDRRFVFDGDRLVSDTDLQLPDPAPQ